MAFRDAADKTDSRIKHDGFEAGYMEIQEDDNTKFLDFLHSGLVEI